MKDMQHYTVQYTAESVADTQQLGRIIGNLAFPGLLLLLTGELGSGKTTFTQGVCWGLGLDEYAKSPTFTLVNQYQARLPISHIDLYRLDSLVEIADIGIEEYTSGETVTIIEWAEKAVPLMPVEHMRLFMTDGGADNRKISLQASGLQHKDLLRKLRKKEFWGKAKHGIIN